MRLLKLNACLFMIITALSAQATDIGVAGLFPGKAVLIIDGAAPKTYSVGDNVRGDIRLTSVTGSTATVNVKGKLETIGIGEFVSRSAPSANASVTLKVNGAGHFVAQSQVNGGIMTMLVDTGATVIALPASDAIRLGINYKRGQKTMMNTANGLTPGYRVRLDIVKVGDIEIRQVDAVVLESGLSFALLGMSFLNRTEMRREGDMMVLTKRF
ncbi:TIGR02281 family clan AA aspartic protease [Glaciimonas sp. CA11.2]|uniref:retropepsin-like aspartic protease family protein n=2 Tax=Glaciimonas TaxID=1229970 RepID=UPI002AB45920|nr:MULTISPECIES: TIGR02281 family clan AA aspartic protease [unclassified Glaciimonas]MDY7547424.1 TIGR02281 family clan AA aspartic protease [Glaciimonas sp. CA11.2]MEB0013561.1 TIGR02281 family clan AA aspartic protease [Glaciimonas sp. Cout2]MEB0083238.1 TIGR02281 family clan AA aspartic protease [Glaciimonas sp. Gout2]MEB0163172.1 TIGR02281 family clan AA aspartic protease [Glaciimonas sp. CA11.2]